MLLQKYNRQSKINKVIILATIIVLVGAGIYYINKKNKLDKLEVSVSKAKELLDMFQVNYVLDVKEQDEYETVKYPGAINVPFSLLKNNMSLKDVPDLNEITADSKILLYCQSGSRARQAANIIVNQGYENVKYVGEGNLFNI
jgi:rhodanese-related sulfurtransferase